MCSLWVGDKPLWVTKKLWSSPPWSCCRERTNTALLHDCIFTQRFGWRKGHRVENTKACSTMWGQRALSRWLSEGSVRPLGTSPDCISPLSGNMLLVTVSTKHNKRILLYLLMSVFREGVWDLYINETNNTFKLMHYYSIQINLKMLSKPYLL